MPYISEPRKYDLLLTPQFYIYKKESLPIKYGFQAKKLAPSILEELLGEGEYSYAVLPDGDDWSFYAYDMNKIESFLKNKRLDSHYINKIYFAQQSKDFFADPISVDDKNALLTIDDTVVMLPKTMVESQKFYPLDEDARPEKGIIPPQSRSSMISQKQSIAIAVLMSVLAIGYIVEGVGIKHSLSKIESEIEATKSKYPSLRDKPSMIINNIYNSAYKIDKRQRDIREKIKSISHLLGKGSKIDNLEISSNGYKGTISVEKNKLGDIQKLAKKNKINAKLSGNLFSVKGSI